MDAIGGKKEEFFFIDGNKSTHQTKSIISSVFIGSLVKVSNSFSSSLTIGSSFFSNKAHFGIRPSVIYYPSKIEKWNIKMMFTHVPFKDDFTGIDFGYLSVSIGINLSK
nr:hypothetical protein [uncultured Pedobacter sp.]